MPSGLLRFLVGLAIGAAVGFLAANAFDRSRQPQGVPAAVNVSTPQTSPSPAGSDELSDEELNRAIAAVNARPNDYDAQFNLAEALLRIAGKPADSITYYRRASELRPKSAEPLAGLGDANFAAAVVASPETADARTLLADAVAAYSRALAIEPRNAGILASRGMAYSILDSPRMTRAIADYNTALGIDANHEAALLGLAVALSAEGKVDEANAAVDRLARAHPDSPGIARARSAIASAPRRSR